MTHTASGAIIRADAGSIKGTVRATVASGSANAGSTLISGARLTLVNRDLPTQSFKTVTDDTGSFIFPNLPAANYILTAEADTLPNATREINLTSGATLVVEIELTASVSESVTIRDEEGLLSTSETTTSNVVRSETLKNLPLRAENYQSALLLTPGVVARERRAGSSQGRACRTERIHGQRRGRDRSRHGQSRFRRSH